MVLSDYLLKFKGPALHIVGPFFREDEIPSEPVIYVDRGADYRVSDVHGWAVGDGDSACVRLNQALNPKKNYSDLAFVLGQILPIYSDIYLHGFLGHRRDHELINFAEAHTFLKKAVGGTKVNFEKQVVGFSAGSWAFDIHGVFTLFAFEEVAVNLSGDCDFKIEANETLRPLSSHGLSNRGHGRVEIKCSGPVFLYCENA